MACRSCNHPNPQKKEEDNPSRRFCNEQCQESFYRIGLKDYGVESGLEPIDDDDTVGLQSSDGRYFRLSRENANKIHTIRDLVEDVGSDAYIPIPNVDSEVLDTIVRYVENGDESVITNDSHEYLIRLAKAIVYLDVQFMIYEKKIFRAISTEILTNESSLLYFKPYLIELVLVFGRDYKDDLVEFLKEKDQLPETVRELSCIPIPISVNDERIIDFAIRLKLLNLTIYYMTHSKELTREYVVFYMRLIVQYAHPTLLQLMQITHIMRFSYDEISVLFQHSIYSKNLVSARYFYTHFLMNTDFVFDVEIRYDITNFEKDFFEKLFEFIPKKLFIQLQQNLESMGYGRIKGLDNALSEKAVLYSVDEIELLKTAIMRGDLEQFRILLQNARDVNYDELVAYAREYERDNIVKYLRHEKRQRQIK